MMKRSELYFIIHTDALWDYLALACVVTSTLFYVILPLGQKTNVTWMSEW